MVTGALPEASGRLDVYPCLALRAMHNVIFLSFSMKGANKTEEMGAMKFILYYAEHIENIRAYNCDIRGYLSTEK